MTDTNPITPDPPIPPGEDVRAPDIEVEPPDDRETPDAMAVNEDAAATEAPD